MNTNTYRILIILLLITIAGLVIYQFNYLEPILKDNDFVIDTPAGRIKGSIETKEQ